MVIPYLEEGSRSALARSFLPTANRQPLTACTRRVAGADMRWHGRYKLSAYSLVPAAPRGDVELHSISRRDSYLEPGCGPGVGFAGHLARFKVTADGNARGYRCR